MGGPHRSPPMAGRSTALLLSGLDEEETVVHAGVGTEARARLQRRGERQLARRAIGAVLGRVVAGVNRDLVALVHLEMHVEGLDRVDAVVLVGARRSLDL